PQKESLDLSMSRITEERIKPSAPSAPHVRGEQIEFNEIDQNDVSSLNAPIQEEICRRKSGMRGIKNETSNERHQNETSNERYQNETSNEKYQNETSNIQTIERKQSKGNKGNIKRKHPERSTHIGEKRFKCETCLKRFTASSGLCKHKRTHTGKKPYSCSICGMNFTVSSNRRRHMMTTHTGEKLYNCSVCNKKFSRSCSMKLHMKIHDNDRRRFNCHVCSKAFVTKSYWKKHMENCTLNELIGGF
ncbi:zinc finger protein, partial [Loa loa]